MDDVHDTCHTAKSSPNVTLYTHPNVKIVSFTASGEGSNWKQKDNGRPFDEEPGSLSWRSRSERTIAAGPLTIYRATGSAAFLICGSALQPILRKSQCWCVDEMGSNFVLQIRRPQYWRIELPIATPQEESLSNTLRDVLECVLQFEKTQCPFQRSFSVSIPEQVPTIKRPWKPVPRTAAAGESEPSTSPSNTSKPGGVVSAQASHDGSFDTLRRFRDTDTPTNANRRHFQEALAYFSRAPDQIPFSALAVRHSPDGVAFALANGACIDTKAQPTAGNDSTTQKALDSDGLVSPIERPSAEMSSSLCTPIGTGARCTAGFTPLYAESPSPRLSLDIVPPATETSRLSSSQEAPCRARTPFRSSHWSPSPASTTTQMAPGPLTSMPRFLCTMPRHLDEMRISSAVARRREIQRWSSRSTLSIVQRAILSFPEAVPKAQQPWSPRADLSTSRAAKFPIDFCIRICRTLLWTPNLLLELILNVSRRVFARSCGRNDVEYGNLGKHLPVQWGNYEDEFDDIDVDVYGEIYWKSILDCLRSRIRDLPALDENQIWGVD